MPTVQVHPDTVDQAGQDDMKGVSGTLLLPTAHRRERALSKYMKRHANHLAKAELYFTAFLSVSDMLSDIAVIVSIGRSLSSIRAKFLLTILLLSQVLYYQANEVSYAMATLTCVSLNLAIQSIVVFGDHPLSSQVKEQVRAARSEGTS